MVGDAPLPHCHVPAGPAAPPPLIKNTLQEPAFHGIDEPAKVTPAHPCPPFPVRLKVQFVKFAFHLILIYRMQPVGVTVNVLAAVPAAHEV